MFIEIEKLETIANYAKRKKLSRQHIYRLANKDEITMVLIDKVAFIVNDEKTQSFERKRKAKNDNNE